MPKMKSKSAAKKRFALTEEIEEKEETIEARGILDVVDEKPVEVKKTVKATTTNKKAAEGSKTAKNTTTKTTTAKTTKKTVEKSKK